MYIPHDSIPACISDTQHVLGRLIQAKLYGLTPALLAAKTGLVDASRQVEDLEGQWRMAVAVREGCDDDCDTEARQIRGTLANRGPGTTVSAPFVYIFKDGIDYYIQAPQDEQLKRYGDFSARLTTYLPATDPVLARVPVLDGLIAAWKTSDQEATAALSALDLARTDRTKAHDAWIEVYESTYGELVKRFGKGKAERFFPKSKRAKTAKAKPPPKAPEACDTESTQAE